MIDDTFQNTCPDEALLVKMANNSPDLPEELFIKINAHVENCAYCKTRLEQIEQNQKQQRKSPDFHIWKPGTILSEKAGEDFNAQTHLPFAFGIYELQTMIGEGGMGRVYKAKHCKLNREVAVKFVQSVAWSDLFEEEIRAVGRLRDKNIVSATDAGEYNGTPFLVMELLEGDNLKTYVQNGFHDDQEEQKPLSRRSIILKACDIVQQAASGLKCAHEAGLIHRDIKPANLWITKDGIVKVLDLGLVQDINQQGIAHSLGGTPDFMSPEQSRCEKLDERTDIYSLGCVFYFILTGEKPYPDKKYPHKEAKIKAQQEEPLPCISRIPGKLRAIIRKMTAKNPAERYNSMDEVLNAVEAFKISYQRSIFQTKRFAAGILAVLSLCYAWYYFSYIHVYKEYYADYVERWGIPEGIYPLTKEQVSKRQNHYRIEKQAGKVIRLVHANSAGTPTGYDSSCDFPYNVLPRPAIAEYSMENDPKTKQQKLKTVLYKNRYGRELLKLEYKHGSNNTKTIEFIKPQNEINYSSLPLISISLIDNNSQNGFDFISSKVKVHHITYNSSGFAEKIQFHKSKDREDYVTDKEGIAGYIFEVDKLGRITKINCVDDFRDCEDDVQNVSIIKVYNYDYDDMGNLEWFYVTDSEDNILHSDLAWTYCHCIYDEKGNCKQIDFLNSDKKTLVNYTDLNCARLTYLYDPKGNQSDEFCFDENNKETLSVYKYYHVTKRYNNKGDLCGVSYFDIKGNPCLCSDGYARYEALCNKFGSQTECQYYNVDGKLSPRNEGNSITVSQYDSMGNRVQEDYYIADPTNKRVKTNLNTGYSSSVMKYNPSTGNREKEEYFDKDGKRCIRTDAGYAKAIYTYDDKTGVRELSSFFDTQGNLCNTESGFAKMTVEKNNDNNVYTIKETKDGVKKVKDNVFYRKKYFNQAEQQIQEEYLNFYTGKQISIFEEDPEDNPDLERNFDLQPQIYADCKYNKNYSWKTFTYYENSNNLESETFYFKLDLREQGEQEQIVQKRITYDTSQRPEEVAFWDEEGSLALYQDEFAYVHFFYDEQGIANQISWFDAEGKPVEAPHNFDISPIKPLHDFGTILVNKMDNGDTRVYLYSTENSASGYNGIYNTEYHIDNSKRIKCLFNFDSKNEFVDGVCKQVWDYDNISQYGGDVYSVCHSFDRENNLLERSFENNQNELCEDSNGVATYVWRYDEQNRKRGLSYYNKKQLACEDKSGISSCSWEYDSYMLGEKYPVILRKFNAKSQIRGISFLTSSEEPYLDSKGVAGYNIEYLDGEDTQLFKKGTFIDGQGKRTSDKYGGWYWIEECDKNGIFLRSTLYDKDGKEVPLPKQ